MTSLEGYVLNVKPAMDAFVKSPSKETLCKLDKEIKNFDWMHMKIFQTQILIPLICKLDELNDGSQEIRTGIINCMCHVISKIYLSEKRGLHSIIVVVLKQIRLGNSAAMKTDTSEEIKLATIRCIAEALRRSTSDILETFYTNESSTLVGQTLLTLVEIIDKEKYKKLILSAIECLMVVFYVQDEADAADVVLRNQVADTTFIFLPKIVTTLFKKAMSDDTIGESIKSLSIKALGRVLCIMFEETTNEFKETYDVNAFQKLFEKIDGGALDDDGDDDSFVFENTKNPEVLEEHLNHLQANLRSPRWIKATSKKLRPIFVETAKLTAHSSIKIRTAYANMCCLLLENCANNLKYNFIYMLESVLGISEDEDTNLASKCQQVLCTLQQKHGTGNLFDENAEVLFDAQLTKLPRILNRCDDDEQCTNLLFLKGLLRNLSDDKLNSLLLLPRNMEKFVKCLLSALDLCVTRDLLNEEYTLRLVQNADDFQECAKLPWRKFKNLSAERSVAILYDICTLLGKAPSINRNIFDYCLELLDQQHPAMNELILLLTIMATGQQRQQGYTNSELVNILLMELLKEKHWHLALRPDGESRLEPDKPTCWFVDRTPGLYESAIEVRMQDCDSDDENDLEVARLSHISILDAQFNVLHTCLVLDSLAHCATYKGDTFDQYIFRSLHRVLLKLANNNTHIYQASKFAFISILKALKYAEASHLIEGSTDYITYHLNSLLKKTPESSAAVDILTVVLQLSTRSNTPHLESIFQTIRNECSKCYQTDNINSYLKVFNAFLQQVTKWQKHTTEMLDNVPMQVEFETSEADILNGWLNAKAPEFIAAQEHSDDLNNLNAKATDQQHCDINGTTNDLPEYKAEKQTLPKYIEVIKEILSQVVKFISSGNQTHQILALECLIVGVPLLQDYEDELLPLVHLIWDPFVEKFGQRDPLVVNRCISLLHVMGIHAKEFILKRSLYNVIPHIKTFLNEAAKNSESKCFKVKTQEFKMQLQLLDQLASFIRNLQIEGRHLHVIALTVSQYLSQKQPKELQTSAVRFFNSLHSYNGPFVYLIVLKYLQQKDFITNVYKILKDVNI